MATRLPYPNIANSPPAIQDLINARLPLNIYRMLAHAPTLMPGWLDLGGGILYRAALEPHLRQLAILRTANLCACDYMIYQHQKISAALGVPAEKIAGTAHESAAKLYSKRELLVLQMTEEVVKNVKAGDALFAATVAELGARQTMELLMTIGFYMMAARVMVNTQIEIEDDGGPSSDSIKKFFGEKTKTT